MCAAVHQQHGAARRHHHHSPNKKVVTDQSNEFANVLRDDIRFNATKVATRLTFGKLCRLVVEGSRRALVQYFENEHDVALLETWLCQPHVQKTVRRLTIRGVISSSQAQLLHPRVRSSLEDDNSADDVAAMRKVLHSMDLSLILILVKYLCHLQPPEESRGSGLSFPSSEPLRTLLKQLQDQDLSGAAMLLRLQQTRLLLATVETLNKATSQTCLRDMTRVLVHFGGEEMRQWMQQVLQANETEFDSAAASWYIDQFREWHAREEIVRSREESMRPTKSGRAKDIPLLLKKIVPREKPLEQSMSNMQRSMLLRMDRRPSMRNGSIVNRWVDLRTGMTTEEKNILEKFYNRLVNDVKPDAVIDHLVNRHVLSMEESNEIFSLLKSTEQMQVLLDMLVSKPGNTFLEFLNSLKGRYNFLYQILTDEYLKAQALAKANKPDGIPYCQQTLHARYDDICSNWRPFRWYGDIKVHLRNFYCPLLLLNSKGHPTELNTLFALNDPAIPAISSAARKVVIEGDSGTGKSTLARYLAFNWINNRSLLGRQFPLVFLLNLKIPSTSVKTMMMEQLFGGDFKLTEKEMWSVVEDHQEDCLFILDGYEDNFNEELDAILAGDTLPGAHFIIFSLASFTSALSDIAYRKYILTGFARKQNQNFVKKYVKATRRPMESFRSLLEKLENAANANSGTSNTHDHGTAEEPTAATENEKLNAGHSLDLNTTAAVQDPLSRDPSQVLSNTSRISTFYPPHPIHGGLSTANNNATSSPESVSMNQAFTDSMFHYFSQLPLFCSYLCAMADMRITLEFTSFTNILDYFLTAAKMKLVERDKENRFNVNKAYSQLGEMALDTMKNAMFTVFVYDEPQKDPLVRFGILEEATNLLSSENTRFFFPNRVIQEYLAAKCLDTSGPEDSSRFFQSAILTRHMHNLVVFYCSMKKNDSETLAMRTLFTKIIELNVRMRRSRPREQLKEFESSANGEEGRQPQQGLVTYGNVMSFQLSLECFAVMDQSRSELSRSIAKTFPECVMVQHDGIIPILTLQGLSLAIIRKCDSIKEVDIRLNQLSQHTPNAYLQLANAIPQNANIHTLRILWEDKDLMGHFFRIVCETNVALRRIECIDESFLRQEKLSGQLWSDIRLACQNMGSVKSFAFKQCRHINLVNAVIRNLPNTLEELDLSSSHLNIITCLEVAEKIRASKQLKSLILSSVRMEGMAFNSFITSLANNRSITDLDLSHINLDNVNFFALAESLKANTKLERLDLRHVTLNLRSCEEMVMVMRVNSYLKHIYLTGNRIVEEGRGLLLQNARHVEIHGVEVTRYVKVVDPIASINKYDE